MAGSQFRLSQQALADLESIADDVGSKNAATAVRLLTSLFDAFHTLADHPQVGMLRDDLHPGVRVFVPSKPAHNYVIFFYPFEDGVEISDVIHGARDWPAMFARGER